MLTGLGFSGLHPKKINCLPYSNESIHLPCLFRKLLGNIFTGKRFVIILRNLHNSCLFCFKDWSSIANTRRSLLTLKKITFQLNTTIFFSHLNLYMCQISFFRWNANAFTKREPEYLKFNVIARQIKETLNIPCSTASSQLTWTISRHEQNSIELLTTFLWQNAIIYTSQLLQR